MEEFKGDKRSKAYKDWKKKYKKDSKGVGDTVEKITKATGIKKAVKFLAGEDCGCEERKNKLNYLFPYYKPKCFTEDEYIYLKGYFQLNKTVIDTTTQKKLIDIYNRVFNEKKETSNCSSCFVNGVYSKLKRLIEEYE